MPDIISPCYNSRLCSTDTSSTGGEQSQPAPVTPEPLDRDERAAEDTQSTASISHAADDFADLLRWKVNKICQATASRLLPMIVHRFLTQLSSFDDNTPEDILKTVSTAPAKHCWLDPAPAWLIKVATVTGRDNSQDLQCDVRRFTKASSQMTSRKMKNTFVVFERPMAKITREY